MGQTENNKNNGQSPNAYIEKAGIEDWSCRAGLERRKKTLRARWKLRGRSKVQALEAAKEIWNKHGVLFFLFSEGKKTKMEKIKLNSSLGGFDQSGHVREACTQSNFPVLFFSKLGIANLTACHALKNSPLIFYFC